MSNGEPKTVEEKIDEIWEKVVLLSNHYGELKVHVSRNTKLIYLVLGAIIAWAIVTIV
jgi:hypothetical protein